MALALTSDPIIEESVARSLLGVADNNIVVLLINGVSEKFKRYTNRTYINKTASIIEYVRGTGDGRVWVHATPIDTTATVQVDILSDGDTDETLTLADSEIVVYADKGEILREGGIWPLSYDERNLKITYTGGWSAAWTPIPGDIVEAAVEQMRADYTRLSGLAGIESASREGQTVSYEQSGLLRSVKNAWNPYRVLL